MAAKQTAPSSKKRTKKKKVAKRAPTRPMPRVRSTWLDADDVRARLEELRKLDPALAVFGASSHKYKLVKPLTEKELLSAETQLGVSLPEDYRRFLLEVGAGGAGPAHGVFPLLKSKGKWAWDGDGSSLTGVLKAPFPHSGPWNLPASQLQAPDDEDEYDAWDAKMAKKYWASDVTRGAICLCDIGCALRQWLVVTGSERGHIWNDDRADNAGISPVLDGRRRVTFADWYSKWLKDARAEAIKRAQ